MVKYKHPNGVMSGQETQYIIFIQKIITILAYSCPNGNSPLSNDLLICGASAFDLDQHNLIIYLTISVIRRSSIPHPTNEAVTI